MVGALLRDAVIVEEWDEDIGDDSFGDPEEVIIERGIHDSAHDFSLECFLIESPSGAGSEEVHAQTVQRALATVSYEQDLFG